ncbi:hypothetical protein QJS10_CPB21g00977 [Acorus calamus]|uniref:Uncharacterized protein n=1 Tax=Acorus calamus TaxID=4465 RepID=A0AAV9C548_ACOCL|nr:hypothetical protein QJS10_CPB21g00977 [Acorus calamus]
MDQVSLARIGPCASCAIVADQGWALPHPTNTKRRPNEETDFSEEDNMFAQEKAFGKLIDLRKEFGSNV